MDNRPRHHQQSDYPDQYQQPSYAYVPTNVHSPSPYALPHSPGISFSPTEQGQRRSPLDHPRARTMPSAYAHDDQDDVELSGERITRKKSLVRPDREKIEPGHRQWHYRTHAAQLEGSQSKLMPSTTGNAPQREKLRRGKSLLAREDDDVKRSTTLRRKRPPPVPPTTPGDKRSCLDGIGPGPKTPWFIYCYVLTCWIPPFIMRTCGLRSPEQQRAWREKMGLMSIILFEMAAVGFITFGFTEAVCGTPPNRYHAGQIQNASVIIHGYDYDFSNFKHPAVGPFNGSTNPLLDPGWGLPGHDASFLFQNVNQNCMGIITRANGSSVTGSGDNLDWYFPCNVFDPQNTSVNLTAYTSGTNCHTNSSAKNGLRAMKPMGQVYYDWTDVVAPGTNLAVYESSILDLNLLQWLSPAQVTYPAIFDAMKSANGTYNGKDLSMFLSRTNQRQLGRCLMDTVLVGFIDTNSIGCVASEVVLYLSLTFIIGVVFIRFVMAVLFAWFFSWKLGNFPRETYEQRMVRSREIEDWSNDIYRPTPSEYRPNVPVGANKQKRGFLPSTSRFTPIGDVTKSPNARPATVYGDYKKGNAYSGAGRKSTMSVETSALSSRGYNDTPCPFPLHNVVPQPSADYEPFNFPLAHTICLVTAYSESVEGLRTTLDSLATTDYPNSHKLILVIADGMVKGAGNELTTPEIVLGMMTELIIKPEDVEAHSYVAIADGHKRHNMAKVYAGFYAYSSSTVERSKQQRVPIVLVAKCGNPLEATDPKPGNRGKRDSQIVLMSFLQKVMFDERMTTFEYEFFNAIWRVTGVSPDRYELVLCVDADTKVWADSMTRMVSCMVVDVEIMGLCGETKIANKTDNFVTMIQVFEYYISHHMTKAFEAMFGGVTCLPGCFSMYRIKAPKGDSGYWVPVLANPDIVEHYSENVVDTLHKKNLLLLGEDRYLTTLLLKTFPKRKNMFCPQAVCKTIVPDTFRVLFSQRRRWINSTVHNLAELLLVRDLCGTFCFSMQFVVGMELAGTLVLPAAISFTLYLIIVSIIPGGTNTTIPLVLLAIVLGLPGLLIVVTSRKVAYIGWMLIYLISLPIWNGLLPAYSFWHFDDFSWGQTRVIAGESADGKGHGDKDGEFDSTHIVMKKWAEFERERRWRGGSGGRESGAGQGGFDRSTRYSMISNSNSDTNHPPSTNESAAPSIPRARHDSNGLLTLPAPLSSNLLSSRSASGSPRASAPASPKHRATDVSPNRSADTRPNTSSSAGMERSSDDAEYQYEEVGGGGSVSRTRLIPSPQEVYVDTYAEPSVLAPRFESPRQFESQVARSGGVLRTQTVSSQYPGETQNPFRSEPLVAAPTFHEDGYSTEPEEFIPPGYPSSQQQQRPSSSSSYQQQQQGPPVPRKSRGSRGVSLADNGPVPGPEGVRRVARPGAAGRGGQQGQNRYSRSSIAFSLPPGAAPPTPGGGFGY